MKKFVSVMITLALLLCTCIPMMQVSAAGNTTAQAVPGTPTVDGALWDWRDAPKYELSKRVVDGSAKTTGYFQVKWDANAIYVAGEIFDETVDMNNDQLKILFDFDGVPAGSSAISFDSRPNAGVHTWTANAYNPQEGASSKNPIAWNPVNAYNDLLPAGATVMGNGQADCGINMQYDAETKTYSFETMWYPSAALVSKLATGTELGFDVRWNDFNGAASADDAKHTTIGWASARLDWNEDLREVGKLVLADAAEAVVQQPEGEAAEYSTSDAKVAGESRYGTPNLDGRLDDWTDTEKFELSKRVVDGSASTTGWFSMKWDEQAIYIAGQMTDATDSKDNDQIKVLFSFNGVPTGENAVTFDNVSNVGIHTWTAAAYNGNGGNSLNPVPWNPENAFNRLQDPGTQVIGDGKNYCMFYYSYENGVYTFESSWFPTDELKARLTEGSVIGFDLRWNDCNDAESPDDTKHTTIGWASTEFDWNTDLRTIGQMTLSAAAKIYPNPATPGTVAPEVEAVTSTTADLKWKLTDGGKTYQINVFALTQENGENVYNHVATDYVAGSTYQVTGLEPATQYAFQVLSYDADSKLIASYELAQTKTLLFDDDTAPAEDVSGSDLVLTPQEPAGNTGVWIIVGAAAGLLLLGGGATFFIVKNKRKSSSEEENKQEK